MIVQQPAPKKNLAPLLIAGIAGFAVAVLLMAGTPPACEAV